MGTKRSASTTWLWAAFVQFALANLSALLLAAVSPDTSVSSGLEIGAVLCLVLLSLGSLFALLRGLFLRLAQPNTTPDDQSGHVGSVAHVERRPTANAELPATAPSGPLETAPVEPTVATSSSATPEVDYRFWTGALIAGVVAWPFWMYSVASTIRPATTDWLGYLIMALHLIALPLAFICLVVASLRSKTNRPQSIKILKIPFYFGFGSLGLWIALDYVWSMIERISIGQYGRM